MIRPTLFMMALAAVGCAADPEPVISGRISAGSFPEAVTQVRAVGATTITADVASDGTFALRLAPDTRYRIEVVSATHRSLLVAPRATGSLDQSFTLADAVDLGGVRYTRFADLGDAAVADHAPPADTGGGGQDPGGGGGGDTGTGGGQDTGGGGGGDTGTGGGGG